MGLTFQAPFFFLHHTHLIGKSIFPIILAPKNAEPPQKYRFCTGPLYD